MYTDKKQMYKRKLMIVHHCDLNYIKIGLCIAKNVSNIDT